MSTIDDSTYFPFNNIITGIVKDLREINPNLQINNKIVSGAIWNYKAVQRHVSRKWKNVFTPALLLRFLKERNWTIPELNNYIFDLEYEIELKDLLNIFMEKIFKFQQR